MPDLLCEPLMLSDHDKAATRWFDRGSAGAAFPRSSRATNPEHLSSGLSEPLLEARALSIRFGGVRALAEVSFAVGREEIFSNIGPNGAGKTSVLICISGNYRPATGGVSLAQRDITALSSARRARLGIGRTFQNLVLFSNMSVLENILTGRHRLMRGTLVTGAFYWIGGARAEEIAHRHAVEDVMEFLDVAHLRHVPAGSLPYGLRKRVELGRAVAMQLKLILLDEPMAGMNPREKQEMARLTVEPNRDRRIAMLMIEHDMDVVANISHRVLALDFRRRIAVGSPGMVLADPKVDAAYMGVET